MKKIFTTLLTTCFLLSCNKVIDEVEVPPFSAYPNPFIDQLGFNFDTNRFPNSPVFIRISDDKGNELITLETITSSPLFFDLSNYKKGIYFIETEISGEVFNGTILKAK